MVLKEDPFLLEMVPFKGTCLFSEVYVGLYRLSQPVCITKRFKAKTASSHLSRAPELPCINNDYFGVAIYFHWAVRSGNGHTTFAEAFSKDESRAHLRKIVGASWEILGSCKAGQQTFPVQDVVGQSVAILQVFAAMDALKMKDLSSFVLGMVIPLTGNLLMAIYPYKVGPVTIVINEVK